MLANIALHVLDEEFDGHRNELGVLARFADDYVIDSYVAFRLAKLTSVKHGQRGRGWAKRYNYAWITSIGIYRLCGTVRYRQAHATR